MKTTGADSEYAGSGPAASSTWEKARALDTRARHTRSRKEQTECLVLRRALLLQSSRAPWG
eukprot:8475519-Alexandrium_andersonii.AAC.2